MAFCKVLLCTDFVFDTCVCVGVRWYKTYFLLWVMAKKGEEYSASEVIADRGWVNRLRVSGSASGPDARFMKANLPSCPTFVFQGLCPDLPQSQEGVVRAPPYERQSSGGGWKVGSGWCLGTSLQARTSHCYCPSSCVRRAPPPTPQPRSWCLAADLGMKLVLMLAEIGFCASLFVA